MPIPYNELDYRILLHHQEAYDCIDDNGHHIFDDWDMHEFVNSILGTGNPRFLYDERSKDLKGYFRGLDDSMPFLQHGEKGQHYAYELFLLPPDNWESRGAPLWWAYAARTFTFDKLPMNEEILFRKYFKNAQKFGFRNLNYEDEIYIEDFSAGGMSSGVVTNRFIRNGWYTIRNRNRLYIKGIEETKNITIDFALSRISRYCSEYKKWIEVNTDVDVYTFKTIFDYSAMTEHQKEVMSDFWGIVNGVPMTLKEVSEKYGVTQNRIRQIERRACQHITRGKNNPIIK